jgi:hypothetical protein
MDWLFQETRLRRNHSPVTDKSRLSASPLQCSSPIHHHLPNHTKCLLDQSGKIKINKHAVVWILPPKEECEPIWDKGVRWEIYILVAVGCKHRLSSLSPFSPIKFKGCWWNWRRWNDGIDCLDQMARNEIYLRIATYRKAFVSIKLQALRSLNQLFSLSPGVCRDAIKLMRAPRLKNWYCQGARKRGANLNFIKMSWQRVPGSGVKRNDPRTIFLFMNFAIICAARALLHQNSINFSNLAPVVGAPARTPTP